MHPLKALCRAAASAVLAFCVFAANAQSIMEPGGWEMKVKVTAREPASGETKTIAESAMKQCVSKAFLDKDSYLTPGIDKAKMMQKGATCSLSDEMRSGNTASWRMVCDLADGTNVDMTIKNTASKHEFSSDMKQMVTKDGKSVPMQIAMNGKFLGKCTPDMVQPK
jgi:hypothetical protein